MKKQTTEEIFKTLEGMKEVKRGEGRRKEKRKEQEGQEGVEKGRKEVEKGEEGREKRIGQEGEMKGSEGQK